MQNQTTSVLIAGQYKLAADDTYGNDIYSIHGNLYSAKTLKSYLADVFNALSYYNGTGANDAVALTAANFDISPATTIYKDIVVFVPTKTGDALLNSTHTIVISADMDIEIGRAHV